MAEAISNKTQTEAISNIVLMFFFLEYIVHVTCVKLSERGLGPFHNRAASNLSKYKTDVTPNPGFYNAMKGIILPMMTIWLIYPIAKKIRGTDEGDVYTPVVSQSTYILITLALATKTVWIFFWDRKSLGYAFIAVLLSSFGFFLSEFSAEWHITAHRQEFTFNQLLLATVIHNGLALCKEWIFVCSLFVHLSPFLLHRRKFGPDTSCTVPLLILATKMVICFILDLFVFDEYTRYVITPYIADIMGSAAVVQNGFQPRRVNSRLPVLMLGSGCLMLLVKIVMIF